MHRNAVLHDYRRRRWAHAFRVGDAPALDAAGGSWDDRDSKGRSLSDLSKHIFSKRRPLLAPTDPQVASENRPSELAGDADIDAPGTVVKRRSLKNILKRFLIPAGGTFTLAILLTQLNQIADLTEKLTRIVSPHVESETSVIMATANDDNIVINVSNTGGKPSTLLDYRLDFGELPIETRTLRPLDSDQPMVVIPGHKNVIMRLTALGLRARLRDDGRPGRFSKEEIDERINGQNVTLEINVRESNDPRSAHFWNLIKPRISHKAVDSFPAERIRDFILHWLPSHKPT